MVHQTDILLDKARRPEEPLSGTTSMSRSKIQGYQTRGDNCAMDLAEMIKIRFRGLQCQACLHFMGYQSRLDPSMIVCSGVCMQEVDQRMEARRLQTAQQNGSSCNGYCGSINSQMFGMPQQYTQQPSLLGAPPGMQLIPIPNPYGMPGYIYVPTMPPTSMMHPPVHHHHHPQHLKPERVRDATTSCCHQDSVGSESSPPASIESTDVSPSLYNSHSQLSSPPSQTVDAEAQPMEQKNGSPRPQEVVEVDLTEPKRDKIEEPVQNLPDQSARTPSVEIPELEKIATLLSGNLVKITTDVVDSGETKQVTTLTQPTDVAPVKAQVDVQQQKPEPETKKLAGPSKNLLKNIGLSTSLYDQAQCCWQYIWTPTKFTLSAIKDIDKIDEMSLKIADHCAKAPPMTKMPLVGEIVYAPYEEAYYRAVVIKRNLDKNVITVDFVDFGDGMELPLKDCKEPSPDIDYPIFGVTLHLTCNQHFPPEVAQEVADAIEAKFENPVFIQLEKKVDEFNWIGDIYPRADSDVTIRQFLNDYVLKKPAVEEKKPQQNPVPKLIPSPFAVYPPKSNKILEAAKSTAGSRKSESDAESVSSKNSKKRQMFKKRFAEDDSTSIASLAPLESATPEVPKPRPQPQAVPNSISDTTQQPLAKPAKVPPQQPTLKTPDPVVVPETPAAKSSSPLLIGEAKFSKALKHSAVVRINYLFTMGRLLVYAVSDEDKLAKLTLDIENYVTQAPGLNRMPVLQEILIAPYEGVYYRGKVVSFDEQYAVIRFLDYGDQARIPITELKEVPESIRKIPIYGLELKMVGVPDDTPFIESPLISAVHLKESQVELIENLEPGVFTARLWFGHHDDSHWAYIVNVEYMAQKMVEKTKKQPST